MATPVQSIDRILDIVEILAAHPNGISLSELAEVSELHPSTTHRLLGSLVSRGYAIKNPDTGKYRLTLRIFEVGSRVANSSNLLTVSRPILERLQHATGETVHLVVRDGSDVVYLYKESDGSVDVRMGSTIGNRSPMYCTGVGKAILATLSPEDFENTWLQSTVQQHTKTTITNIDDMSRECRKIRALGYSVDREEHENGVCCVASSVDNCFGRTVAAISISLPAFRFSQEKEKELSVLVTAASKEISVRLGKA